MLLQSEQIKSILAGEARGVYLLYGQEPYLIARNKALLLAFLAQQGADASTFVFDGEDFAAQELVNALQNVSFTGGAVIAIVDKLSKKTAADNAAELAALFADIEGATVIITFCDEEEYAFNTKAAKTIIEAANKHGVAISHGKLPTSKLELFIKSAVENGGAQIEAAAVRQLILRIGSDLYALENEVKKLCAGAAYGTIDEALVEALCAKTIEGDVFKLVNALTSTRRAFAQAELSNLVAAGYEPVAITAALASSFIDMYRVKTAAAAKKTSEQVFKDMGYTGNIYRLKKSLENAHGYSLQQLRAAICIIEKLDLGLKSSQVAPQLQLEAALQELIFLGGGIR